MKLLNKKQKNNKGFSLVELIVVIAIMVVLVAVLAPVFTKYIESSRRSTDVQNASSIGEAVLADAADNKTIPEGKQEVKSVDGKDDKDVVPTAIKGKGTLKVKGDVKTGDNASTKGASFYYQYNKDANTCAVYAGDYGEDLTTEKGAQAYKDE